MNRREFLSGMAGILASGAAPAFVGSSILMPMRSLVVPTQVWNVNPLGGFIYAHDLNEELKMAFDSMPIARKYEWQVTSI